MESSIEASHTTGISTTKPTLGNKPRLAPKPFSLKNPTIRSIHAPKTLPVTSKKTTQQRFPRQALPNADQTPTTSLSDSSSPIVLTKDPPKITKETKKSPHGEDPFDYSVGKSDLVPEAALPKVTPKSEPKPIFNDSIVQTNHKVSKDTGTKSEQQDRKKEEDEPKTSIIQKLEESGSGISSPKYRWSSTRKRLSMELTSKFESSGIPLFPQPSFTTSTTSVKDDSKSPTSSDLDQSQTASVVSNEANDTSELEEDCGAGGSIKRRISLLLDSSSRPEVTTKRDEPEIVNGTGGVKARVKNWAKDTSCGDPKFDKKPQVVLRARPNSIHSFEPVTPPQEKVSPKTPPVEPPAAGILSRQVADPPSKVLPTEQPRGTPMEVSSDALVEDVLLQSKRQISEEHTQNALSGGDVLMRNRNPSSSHVATDEVGSAANESAQNIPKRDNVKRRSVRFGVVERDDGGPPVILGSASDSSEEEEEEEEEDAASNETPKEIPASRHMQEEAERLKHLEFEKKRRAEEIEEARLKLEEEQKQKEEEREREIARQREEEEYKRQKLMEEETERQRKEEWERERVKEEERQRDRQKEERLKQQEEEKDQQRLNEEREKERLRREEMERERQMELMLQRQREEERERARQKEERHKQDEEEREQQRLKEEKERLRQEEMERERQMELMLQRQREEERERARQKEERHKQDEEEREQQRLKEEKERLRREEMERERQMELMLQRQREEERERARQKEERLKQDEEEREQQRLKEEKERLRQEEMERERQMELMLQRQREEERERARQKEERLKQEEEEREQQRLKEKKEKEKLRREEMERERQMELMLQRQREEERERARQKEERLKQEEGEREQQRLKEEKERLRREEMERERQMELMLQRQREEERERARQKEERLKQEEEEREQQRLKEEKERLRREEMERERQMELMLQRQREEERERARQKEERLKQEEEEREQQRLKEEEWRENRLREKRERHRLKEEDEDRLIPKNEAHQLLQKLRQREMNDEKRREEEWEKEWVDKLGNLGGEEGEKERERELEFKLQRKLEEDMERARQKEERLRQEVRGRERSRKEVEEKGQQHIEEEMERMRQLEMERKRELDRKMQNKMEGKQEHNIEENLSEEEEMRKDGLTNWKGESAGGRIEPNLISFDTEDWRPKSQAQHTPLAKTNRSAESDMEVVYEDFSVKQSLIDVDFDDFSVKPKKWSLNPKVETTSAHQIGAADPVDKEEVALLLPLDINPRENLDSEQVGIAESLESTVKEKEQEEEHVISMEVVKEEKEEREKEAKEDEAEDDDEAQAINYRTNSNDKDADTLTVNEADQQNNASEQTSESDGPVPENIPQVSYEDGDTTDHHGDVELTPFPESSTALLDTSAQRAKADVGRSRKRSRPSRSHRSGLSQKQSPDWRISDTSEETEVSSRQRVSEAEEEQRKEKIVSSPPQRVPMFPGLSPAALLSQIKRKTSARGHREEVEAVKGRRREEKESPVEEVAPSTSQPARSHRSAAHLAGAARVLPPLSGADGDAASCPSWLKELKSKKR